jgi:antitoxin ParD1/3/4
MNIALSPELEKLIEAKIMSGRYHSATEVIGEALYLLEQQDDLRDLHSGELQTRLDQGPFCSSPRRGADGESFMAGVLEDLDSKADRRNAG